MLKKMLLSYGFKWPYPPIGIQCVKALKRFGIKVYKFNACIESPFFKKINKRLKKMSRSIRWIEHKERINRKLISTVRKLKPDIVLDIGGRFLYPETLKKIKDIYPKIKLCLWATEGARDIIEKDFVNEVRFYDYLFCTSVYVVEEFKKIKVKKVRYLPFGTDIDFYRKIKLSKHDLKKYSCDIGFLGACESNREKVLSQLSEYNLAVWGTEWDKLNNRNILKHIKGSSGLYGRNVVKFYNAAKINININRERYNLYPSGMNLRLFDISACHAFLITQYVEEISSAFKIGSEIEIFHNVEELKEKIKFYLSHEDKRELIAENSYRKIYQAHTWKQRMQEMLSYLNC
ncbi:MAG: hypothetical protein DRP84_08790 [Spirochaetes bacterium]|nr:MAG: hypothetical protein DRP84_08790 [Spirochaetota bacterium]